MSTNNKTYEEREARIIEIIRGGVQPSPEVAAEMVQAKQALQLAVLGETYGGLLGADALSHASDHAGRRYEAALSALEAELGVTS